MNMDIVVIHYTYVTYAIVILLVQIHMCFLATFVHYSELRFCCDVCLYFEQNIELSFVFVLQTMFFKWLVKQAVTI